MGTRSVRCVVLAACALSACLLVSGCGLLSREPELSPQEVVSKFYRWYIGYPGNPLADRAYRDSPYLAQAFIDEVDGIGEDGFVACPFLLAQDIPERFSVDEADVSEDRATVMVSLYWGGNPTPTTRRVDLRLMDGTWKMTDVSLQN